MISKFELLRMLQEAMDLEEKTVPLLRSKCSACFNKLRHSSMMIKEDKHRMIRMLSQLISGAEEHHTELERLIQKVKGSDRDGF